MAAATGGCPAETARRRVQIEFSSEIPVAMNGQVDNAGHWSTVARQGQRTGIMMHLKGRKLLATGQAVAMLGLASCGGGSSDNFAPPNPPPPPPPPVTADIATQRVFPGISFTRPLAMIQLPNNDTRWYVAEQSGIIHVFDNDPNVTQNDVSVFANLTAIVDDGPNEAGLLGIAFHPDFATNGEVYVSYTGNDGGLISRISRFVSQDGGITLSVANEQVLLSLAQPFGNHNGGQIAFGPDGFLYIGFGDGGSSGDPNNNAQTTSNLFGTIARIDVDSGAPYAIPAGNPFAANPVCTQGFGAAPCPEIFAWGLRNPWRWSFDSLNGDLWVGDVGQGSFEEIDRVEPGLNYGWRVREGAHCFNPSSGCATNFEDPITEYGRALGASVTGGYVYRGMAVTDLAGTYVFGDFISGRIFGVPATSLQGTVAEELLDTAHNISSFAEDPDGELYLLDFVTGGIFRIVDAP
jgi:glucose/arabinose dehydrogenase